MPQHQLDGLNKFNRRVDDDPDGWRQYFRMGTFGWFQKPEGEGCLEKLGSTQYNTFWFTAAPMLVYVLGFKKIKNPLAIVTEYGRFVWPIHAASATFAVTACNMCSIRGIDDHYNWGVAGAVASAFPVVGLRNRIAKHHVGHWMWALPLAAFIGYLSGVALKANDPKHLLHMRVAWHERYQYNPETRMNLYYTNTMPDERWSLDFIIGRGKDMPWSWIGEEWEHRQLLTKQQYGYLECELDKVPEYEKLIANRR